MACRMLQISPSYQGREPVPKGESQRRRPMAVPMPYSCVAHAPAGPLSWPLSTVTPAVPFAGCLLCLPQE
jgi:hypothetical protein